jgi:hypothetical protein
MASERDATIEDRLSEVDGAIDSPSVRFQRIMDTLKKGGLRDPLDWDVICFCTEYLGMMAATRFTWLTPAVKHLNWLVYNAHYLATKEMGLWPPHLSGEKHNGQEATIQKGNVISSNGTPETSNDGSKGEDQDSSPRRLM